MSYKKNRWWQKIAALIIIVAIIAPSVYFAIPPKKAEAQGACIGSLLGAGIAAIAGFIGGIMSVPVSDAAHTKVSSFTESHTFGSFMMDCVVIPMVKAAVKALIHQFLSHIVDWINSGFDGSGPRFVSDPAGFFADVADQAVGEAVLGSDLSWLCSPFAADLKLRLGFSYWSGRKNQLKCTLSTIMNDVGSASHALEKGGWQGWLEVTTVPQNNFFGSAILARNEIDMKIGRNSYTLGKETDWAGGFLSTKKCTNGVFYFNGQEIDETDPSQTQNLSNASYKCTEYTTVTPGTTIKDQLSHTLGSQVDELIDSADLDAVIGSLFNQVVGLVFDETGLFNTPGSSVGAAYRQKFLDENAKVQPIKPPDTICEVFSQYVLVGKEIKTFDKATGQFVVVEPLTTTASAPPGISDNFLSYSKYCASQPYQDKIDDQIRLAKDKETGSLTSFPEFSINQLGTKVSLLEAYANQSCTYQTENSLAGPAKLAIDGVTQTWSQIYACGKATANKWADESGGSETNPWWEVILKSPEILESVTIQQKTGGWDGGPLYGLKSGAVKDASGTDHSLPAVILFDSKNQVVGDFPIDPVAVANNSGLITVPLIIKNGNSTAYVHEMNGSVATPSVSKVMIQSGGNYLLLLEVTLNRHIPPLIDQGSLSAIPSTITTGQTFSVLAEGLKATYHQWADVGITVEKPYNFSGSEPLLSTYAVVTVTRKKLDGTSEPVNPDGGEKFKYTITTPGTYTIHYTISDPGDASIRSAEVTKDIIVVPPAGTGSGNGGNGAGNGNSNAPAIASCAANPSTIPAGSSFTLSANISSAPAGTYNFTWVNGVGATLATITGVTVGANTSFPLVENSSSLTALNSRASVITDTPSVIISDYTVGTSLAQATCAPYTINPPPAPTGVLSLNVNVASGGSRSISAGTINNSANSVLYYLTRQGVFGNISIAPVDTDGVTPVVSYYAQDTDSSNQHQNVSIYQGISPNGTLLGNASLTVAITNSAGKPVNVPFTAGNYTASFSVAFNTANGVAISGNIARPTTDVTFTITP